MPAAHARQFWQLTWAYITKTKTPITLRNVQDDGQHFSAFRE
ncbi:hypothetical protein [Hymenobacter amundsenii]|nr:hypothetical protein [Hymenobacter amundsenii]